MTPLDRDGNPKLQETHRGRQPHRLGGSLFFELTAIRDSNYNSQGAGTDRSGPCEMDKRTSEPPMTRHREDVEEDSEREDGNRSDADSDADRRHDRDVEFRRPVGSDNSSLITFGMLTVVALCGFVYIMYGRPTDGPATGSASRRSSTLVTGTKRLDRVKLTPLFATKKTITSSTLADKVVLVNFWQPSCQPCFVEFPHLMDLIDQLRDEREFQFVSVAGQDTADDTEADLERGAADFLQSARVELPVHSDFDGTTRQSLMRAMGWGNDFQYPTTVLLDHGTIRRVWQGYREGDAEDMLAEIQELLGIRE